MSELKARDARDLVLNNHYWPNEENLRVYLKSEADKVIAGKDKEIRRYKYKRCLAMAELCKAKRDEIIARTPTLILSHHTEYLTRWEKRWLELAENFKEAK